MKPPALQQLSLLPHQKWSAARGSECCLSQSAKSQGPKANYRFLSHNFIPALRAELCAGFKLGSTFAAFVLRTQRLAALGTELCSLRMRPARRTERHRL